MNDIPARHPGGRTCRGALPLAVTLTLVALLRHGREAWQATRSI
jgi:hypothetical protein